MACRLVVIKRFTYRGNANEEYSNEYTFSGATPSDAAAWRTLFDALVFNEKAMYPGGVAVVAGYGYDSEAANAHAVWSVDMTVAPNTPVTGTLAVGAGVQAPGDAAVWVRWKTDRLNSKGKPIYLRKYFHPAIVDESISPDRVLAAQVTALNFLGGKLSDGTFLDGRVVKSPGHADSIISHGASTYATTRTLKRRGKRPS